MRKSSLFSEGTLFSSFPLLPLRSPLKCALLMRSVDGRYAPPINDNKSPSLSYTGYGAVEGQLSAREIKAKGNPLDLDLDPSKVKSEVNNLCLF